MPDFDIVKTNKPKLTFRVSKIQSDFDVKFEHSSERFVGNIELPEKWQIGVIVGASGTGKTTIAKEIFSECIATKKAISRTDKQFVAVTCHFDVVEWIEPDWVFNTDTMKMVFPTAHGNEKNMLSKDVGVKNGENLGVIII